MQSWEITSKHTKSKVITGNQKRSSQTGNLMYVVHILACGLPLDLQSTSTIAVAMFDFQLLETEKGETCLDSHKKYVKI